MTINDVAELTYVACLVRGIFRVQTYQKAGYAGQVVAAGIQNPVANAVVQFATAYTVAPLVAAVEGGRGFVQDAKNLVGYITK